jgi:hypothetical protein
MTTVLTKPSTFLLFSTLPRELRDQIWRYALPNDIGPALFFFKKGCWCPRRRTAAEYRYDAENDENNLVFEWRADLLDDIEFEIPMVFVNREARGIVLDWIREQGFKTLPSEKAQQPFFLRSFDQTRDALYVGREKWIDFLCDPSDTLFQPELLNQHADVDSDLTRLALPEGLLQQDNWVDDLPEMFRHFFGLRELLIIVGAQPNLQSVDNDKKVPQRWEFESAQRGALIWNDDRSDFDFEDGERVGDELLYRLMRNGIDMALREVLIQEHIHKFEIRPVIAVER